MGQEGPGAEVNLERSSSGIDHRHRRLSSHIYRAGGPIQARAGVGVGRLGARKNRHRPQRA